MGDLLCLFTGAPPSGRGLTGNDTEIKSISFSVSFPVNPRPDGGAPVNRHNKSPIDATRALIGRTLVLMTLNPFERVAVSLKLVSMLLTAPLLPRPLSSLSFHANKFSRDL